MVLLLVLIALKFTPFFSLMISLFVGKPTCLKPQGLGPSSMIFCNASGQTPNLAKSHIIFSKNVDDNARNDVKIVFPIDDLAPNSIYLGHPLIFNHADRTKACSFILNKFRAKLTNIKSNKLNHAGRLVYINSVLNFIPIYYMSTVFSPKKLLQRSLPSLGNSGGLGFRRIMVLVLFIFAHGMTFANLRTKGALESEMSTKSTRASSFMLLGTLLIIKILS